VRVESEEYPMVLAHALDGPNLDRRLSLIVVLPDDGRVSNDYGVPSAGSSG
jgi:hypothetical protein